MFLCSRMFVALWSTKKMGARRHHILPAVTRLEVGCGRTAGAIWFQIFPMEPRSTRPDSIYIDPQSHFHNVPVQSGRAGAICIGGRSLQISPSLDHHHQWNITPCCYPHVTPSAPKPLLYRAFHFAGLIDWLFIHPLQN